MGSNERGSEDGREEEEEEEEEKGMRAGREERRSDSRLLSGVPLTPSPTGRCSLPTSGGVSSGLRCPPRAVPPPARPCCGAGLPRRSPPRSFSLSPSRSFHTWSLVPLNTV